MLLLYVVRDMVVGGIARKSCLMYAFYGAVRTLDDIFIDFAAFRVYLQNIKNK